MAARILLVRHGQTEWSLTGQHTGRTDIPLLEEGRRGAKLLGERLHRAPWDGLPGVEVRTSPLVPRARDVRAGGLRRPRAASGTRCMEWDYGAYEGLTPDGDPERPGRTGSSGATGCRAARRSREVAARADEVVSGRARRTATCWSSRTGTSCASWARAGSGYEPSFGARLRLDPASLSVLGWAYGEPAIERWNDTGHLD